VPDTFNDARGVSPRAFLRRQELGFAQFLKELKKLTISKQMTIEECCGYKYF
jgi:hypothetical protein